MKNTALLKLMHLVSPALPVGAYAYSQGQEYAVDAGWVNNTDELHDWLSGVLQYSLAHLDLPVLIRLYRAWQNTDRDALCYWNQYLRANRETAELLLEDEQLGLALRRLLVSLGITRAEWMAEKASGVKNTPTFACMFALAGVEWEIPLQELLLGFTWSWLENQVAAATKTIPLGQTQAQQLLVALTESVAPALQAAEQLSDDDIGMGLPGLALASAHHERQYSRLFRS